MKCGYQVLEISQKVVTNLHQTLLPKYLTGSLSPQLSSEIVRNLIKCKFEHETHFRKFDRKT